MPSLQVGAFSGGVQLVSGNPFSGNKIVPYAGIQVKVDPDTLSGLVWLGYSGGLTIKSGGALSSGGMLDGFPLKTGEQFFIPKLLAPTVDRVWLTTVAANSGIRVSWEAQ